jgi:metallo-beta-lactamase class B
MQPRLNHLLVLVLILGGFSVARGQGVDPTDKRAVQLMFNAWKPPIAPRKLIGNIHYVGAVGVSSFLITTPQGHVLIDTTFEDLVPRIQQNIEQLGFKVTDIKFILATHAHADHAGGHALMKQLSKAAIYSSEPDAHLLETGGEDDFSPFPKEFMKYTPVKADKIVRDGDTLSIGGTTLTAHLTPGHTQGATTWTMQVDDNGTPRDVVFFSSVGLVRGTRLTKNPSYPKIVEDYESTLKKMREMKCDVFFSPHGSQFSLTQKMAKLDQKLAQNPFIDPENWKQVIESSEKSFRDAMTAQSAGN